VTTNSTSSSSSPSLNTSLNTDIITTSNIVLTGETFNTILIRRTDAVLVIVNSRTLQIYVNNVNIIESATSSTQSTDIVGGAIRNVIEFITWNNSFTNKSHPSTFKASRIRENIVDTSHSIFSVNLITSLMSLYIPLTQNFNISDIQSFVLYNRNNNASDQLRIQDFQIELYNRSNGFIPGESIIYTMPINTSVPVYRYDLPSISTYTLGFSDVDSLSLIKNIRVSDSNFINKVLKTEGGNVEIKGSLSATSAIINYKNIEDRDHFHYASSHDTISKSVNQTINYNLTKRGSALVSGESFVPKYTGLYSISCSIYFGTGSTGAFCLGVNKWNEL
jgi:hypothetical protein